MKKLIAILLTLALLPCFALAEDNALAVADGATITVTGSATVTLQADYARISVGVSTKAATVEEATKENSSTIFAVIAGLMESNIAKEDIATSSYSVYANYDYSTGESVLSGYTVTNQLTVLIRDMDHIGAILDRAAAAGANNIYNIEFLSTQSSGAQDEATAYAVQDAVRKAQLLADAAGLTLGGIVSIQESTSTVYVTARSYESKLAADALTNTILPNDTSVSASVTIVFELK